MQSPNLPATDRWGHPTYLLKRKLLKLLGGAFMVYSPGGELVFYVEQKAFKLKEDIRVYGDEAKTQELLTIKARQIMDMSAAYDVVDATTGQKIGMLQRRGWKSIARDEWNVCNAQDVQFATLIEDNMVVALLRRLLTNLIPQNYDMLINNQRVVDYAQNFNPFNYHLKIDFTWDKMNQVDRRLGIASMILLAAIEGKQK